MAGSVKKGCLGFIVILAIFGLGAGLSVVMRAKSLKPKSRALISSRPEKMLEKIRGEFAGDVSESDRKKFEGVYKKLIEDMLNGETSYQNRLTAAAEELARIRADGKITAEETEKWIKLVLKTEAENSVATGEKKLPAATKRSNNP